MSNTLSNKVAKSMMLRLYPAQILALLFGSLNGLFCSLLIGNLMGSKYIAVFGFCGPLSSIQAMLSGCISLGCQILAGRYMGKGDSDKVGMTYATSAILCIIIGAVATVAYQFIPMQIATILGAFGSDQILVADYLRGLSWGLILTLLFSLMILYLQLSNATYVMTLVVVVMTVVNFVGNVLNIFVFKMGMFGCGFACSVSYMASALVVVIYYFSGKCTNRLNFSGLKWSFIKEIFKLGVPNLVHPFCQTIRNLVLNNIAVRISGTMAISALAIMGNVSGIFGTLVDSMPDTVSMTASIFYGERDKRSLREVSSIGLCYGMLFALAAYLPVFFFAPTFARLFGAEPEIIPFVSNALRLIMLFLLTCTPYVIVTGVYKGLGKTRLVNIITIIDKIIVPIPAVFILSKFFGINGVWVAFALGEGVTFLLEVLYAAIKLGHFPRKLSEVVYIPENFGIPGTDRCNVVIRSVSDAMKVSQRVIDFCREKKLDEKIAYDCGFCIEEISIAILEHGEEQLKGKTRNCEIDVRIIYEDNGLTMMLRDNYPNFNPEEWVQMYESEDRARVASIRAIRKLAKSIDYSVTLNLNLITIRIGN